MRQHKIFIILTTSFLLACTAVLNFFPRSKVSALEKRELRTFPDFSWKTFFDGSFTNDISLWYSDSEPFRDDLMTVSMLVNKYQALSLSDEDAITFVGGNTPLDDIEPIDDELGLDDDSDSTIAIDEFTKIANAGIIIIGKVDSVRALMCYGGVGGGTAYANAANTYQSTFGSSVRVYCMVIPNSTEYYLPEKVRNRSRSQLSTIQSVESKLTGGVRSVNIWQTLYDHKNEDIFLRTDHHWAPLGAYYAAKEFARVAGVPFLDINKDYDRHVVHGFVGSMYGYSGDISVKQSPEDFVYWTPRNISYTTTYITYTLDKQYHIVGESKPHSGAFFYHQKNGSGNAYCTFMGSDCKITNVKTSTKNGRRLLILKDSFGNAIPGWLFGSFEEINVVDCRYFTKNMVKFVEERRITDILFANNVYKAYSPNIGKAYVRFLSQSGGLPKYKAETTDSTATDNKGVTEPAKPTPEKTPRNTTPDTGAATPLVPNNENQSLDQF